jgi:hypothetical protein
LHRLDRTSLRLAHSLDYLVGAGEQHGRSSMIARLRSAGHCGEFSYVVPRSEDIDLK